MEFLFFSFSFFLFFYPQFPERSSNFFPGIYLRSFICIEENPSFLDDQKEIVNVVKLSLISNQIEEIKSLQKPILKLWEVEM